MKNFSALQLFVFILFFQSCHIIDDPEKLPMYVEVEDLDISYSQPTETGRGLINTPDVWISVDENQLGVYHLPNVFPFIPDDKDRVTITARPGIRINGISATRGAYPFYTPWDTTVDVSLKDTVKINPKSTYADNVHIPWIADFESAGTSSILSAAPNSTVLLERTLYADDESKGTSNQGNYFGKAVMESGEDMMYLIVGSSRFLENPVDGSPFFLEMEYDATAGFDVNIRYTDPEGVFDEVRIMQINPTRSKDEPVRWNKIYINLSDRLLEPQINIDEFAFSIITNYSENNQPDYPAEFRFDNLKIVTR